MRRKLLIIIVFFSILNAYGQSFNRVEDLVGFGQLQKNNGVSVADYDLDGDLDVFVVAIGKDTSSLPETQSKLFRNNNNGTFSDVTNEAGLNNLFPVNELPNASSSGLEGFKYGAYWGDINNNGYPDLFLTNEGRLQLFKNNGNGTFTDITITAGILNTETQCTFTCATWLDINNDRFLDLYISEWNKCGKNKLFINNNNETFTDVSDSYAPNSDLRPSFLAYPFDFNEDGFIDIFLNNDFEPLNEVFLNQAGASFVDAAVSLGLQGIDAFRPGSAMGMAVGDYNNDGKFDFYTTNINTNNLFVNQGNNTFNDEATSKNVLNTGWSWDATFSDFDLDGFEDLYVVSGYNFTIENIPKQRNVYYKNNNGTFNDISAELGFNEVEITVGATPFDYDNDGDLDLFVTNSNTKSYFYENESITATDFNKKWFQVSLEGTLSNRQAIGSIITIETDEGNFHRHYTGTRFLSQSIQPVHFGLGKATKINKLTIKWPSGLEENFTEDLILNTFYKVKENTSIEKLAIEPAIKAIGCTDPASCSFNPIAVVDDGSCMYLNSGNIVGELKSQFFSVESYTYNSENTTNTIQWNVSGGKIEEGQGTNTIKVHWELSNNAKIGIIETDENCSTLQVDLDVDLTYDLESNTNSIARVWNEALLYAVRGDFARPTVHARNLFHSSIAMYDAWAIFDDKARPYLTGTTLNGFKSEFEGFNFDENDKETKRTQAISYAVYRVLKHRFKDSPNKESTLKFLDDLMEKLGYDINLTDTFYQNGGGAFLGNFIAETVIEYGLQDGSREITGYDNAFYKPVNKPLDLNNRVDEALIDANRWQPLTFDVFIDQSGNPTPGKTPEFLNPEWGNVLPFALTNESKKTGTKDGNIITYYNDPGLPPLLKEDDVKSSEIYKWGFSLVSQWSSHLDTNDGVIWDISPKSQGNFDISNYPKEFSEYKNFYKDEGGDGSPGRAINPKTNQAYQENKVPRGDYARVLAEFWADGPDSETPPGHWYTILNTVNDHPELKRNFEGQGEELEKLEWDVKAYFLLGGAMHDAAVSTWSVKGWYDYIRPISALRNMALMGQSTDNSLPNFNKNGIPLKEGLIEVIKEGDPLSEKNKDNIGKIKLYAWQGNKSVFNPSIDKAGVAWVLASEWEPYQRPSFVTPPFAGYVSGHSTFSRAAAEVLTLFTGDEFFPGGLGEFKAKKNEFLVFEEGPSVDVTLQWATYRDASDQSGLSRIWGGIHPPVDDIPGRIIGEKVGIDAFNLGVTYFSGKDKVTPSSIGEEKVMYPNPVKNQLFISNTLNNEDIQIFDLSGGVYTFSSSYNESTLVTDLDLTGLASGVYILKIGNEYQKFVKQ